MKLNTPTDFDILDALDEHGNLTPGRIAHYIDRSDKYVNNRLAVLRDYGLVEYVPPEELGQLYRVTDAGRRALDHQESYAAGDDEWEETVREG